MKAEQRITAFVDILGMGARLSKWDGSGELPELVEKAFRRATSFVGGKRAFRKGEQEEWHLSLFSDSACISQPATPIGLLRALEGVALFQRAMLTHGFIVRGGISIGMHYQSDLILLSKALLDAYNLEQHHDRKPRILVSESLLSFINSIADQTERHEVKELITFEDDSHAFVCYLLFEEEDEWLGGESFYKTQRDMVASALNDSTLPSDVQNKYLWIGEFHNWALWKTAHYLKTSAVGMAEDEVWWFRSLWINKVPFVKRFKSALALDRDLSSRFPESADSGVNWITDWPGILSEDHEPEDHD